MRAGTADFKRTLQPEIILRLRGVSCRFGGLTAVDALSLAVRRHRITSLIGPNGAGKTTVINVISGIYRAGEGSIELDNYEISTWPPHRIARLGIKRTFQNLQVFGRMTVMENVLIGLHQLAGYGLFSSLFHRGDYYRGERAGRRRALEILELFGLAGKQHRLAAELPYGEQKRIEIARAIVSRPKLVMLDEPAAGLNPRETEELARMIATMKEIGITVLLVEHDMNLVMGISDVVIALNFGQLLTAGPPPAVAAHPEVVKAYLKQNSRCWTPTTPR